ncbi:hypothetical protein [Candidatus Paracaedibacter symbiosus]|uniref:hypothetical protein n=1 Tax=Candidatus Paracaedibacter symbiosus TaxID=244582 RepID=UPI0018DBA128|nr:hypothetical protein [Candidatus Paracaedibacter symbiosus]
MNMGWQWEMLPLDKDETGRAEIHYSQIFRIFQEWLKCGTLVDIFENSAFTLHAQDLLDTSVTHGDWTTTMAKKGGDCLGYSGQKHIYWLHNDHDAWSMPKIRLWLPTDLCFKRGGPNKYSIKPFSSSACLKFPNFSQSKISCKSREF